MALVQGSVIGEVKGKMGTKVFREMNGKTFVSDRPLHYKPTKSPAAKKVRSSFRTSVKLSQKLISSPALKEVWANAKIEGTDAYRKVIKHNRKSIYSGSLTERNIITPDGLFLKVESAGLQNEVIHLTLNCPAENKLVFPAKLSLLYYFGSQNNSLVLTDTAIPESTEDGIYELDLKPAKSIIRLLNENPDAMLFVALVSGTAQKKKVYWTNTECFRLS